MILDAPLTVNSEIIATTINVDPAGVGVGMGGGSGSPQHWSPALAGHPGHPIYSHLSLSFFLSLSPWSLSLSRSLSLSLSLVSVSESLTHSHTLHLSLSVCVQSLQFSLLFVIFKYSTRQFLSFTSCFSSRGNLKLSFLFILILTLLTVFISTAYFLMVSLRFFYLHKSTIMINQSTTHW